MNWVEALILGLVQGLTEFLPVSSSGHLEIGKALLQIEARDNLTFSIVVHGATVLSILVVFFNDLKKLLTESLTFRYNESSSYLLKIILSMVPVAIVGVFFKSEVEAFFTGNIVFVGSMLLITATLLTISFFIRRGSRNIGYLDAFIIGIAQAFAVLPGISRAGATITTALFLGNKREEAARFSFLMVILPIIAANFLDLLGQEPASSSDGVWFPLLVGFIAAFVSGLIACRWMLS
ncbi:MAG: undecaprenyl-diphosphate phosphatase, partial [Bacteroidales bacterium]|nr:undecaprenyl-diphosphate phosphatase [Bacteroidales bacterium]